MGRFQSRNGNKKFLFVRNAGDREISGIFYLPERAKSGDAGFELGA
jgi:hypothetical protein